MTHLYIELSTGLTEEVNNAIISKLYELAISGDLDETSGLKGRLHSSAGYDAQIAYLNNTFDNLYLSVDNLYITFEDSEVQRVLSTKWGDGIGVTETLITSHNKIDASMFVNNKNIVSFNELGNYANITRIEQQAFENSSLTYIDLSNILYIGFLTFRSTNLTGIINLPSLISISGRNAFTYCKRITEVHFDPNIFNGLSSSLLGVFENCSNLITVTGLSNTTSLATSSFAYCSELLSVTGLSNATTIGDNSFRDCSNLQQIDIDFSKVTSIGLSAFRNSGIQTFIIDSATPPSLGTNAFTGNNGIIYVPDASVNDYKSAIGWSEYASRIKGISELPS